MPRGEKLTDAIRYEKVDGLKNDLFAYIDNSPDKISANLPVFFGHVMSALDHAFPDIDNNAYDEFIDAIAYRLMVSSKDANKVDFVENIIKNALRCKRKKSGRSTLRILSGIKMMEIGRYREAIGYFGEYWKYDARIGIYIAYCNYCMSEIEGKRNGSSVSGGAPSRFELQARESLLELARVQPPVARLKQLDMKDNEVMERAFWVIIRKSLEWFPTERWFLKIGIQKAKNDNNDERRAQLLSYAIDKYYNDQDFLRENFYLKLEKRDGVGASGVVKQMIQQNPDSLEPLYYGIKLSLLSNSKGLYNEYRDTALDKGMPHYLIQLFDLALFIMRDEKHEAELQLKHLKKRFKSLSFYLITIDYLIKDIFSEENGRKKVSKNAFFESLDRYAVQVIKIQE
ncbi:hypothetical protein F1737_02365 [Methanoplanus sp. FWC-SCC4]|uniref:Uncharacterized protein n=1 Tax=Methanochimaera problematica TaxID=2609417 RepID=A0AA97FAW5_9EURY|nr:hypothetical protein [Methanoplanus sp. FWC-SCC4]WOF15609.1 hypothetical protein F1737_02365 [Methanoplanus sp. FWC-SCC4]